MPRYRYRALTDSGQAARGEVEAATTVEARLSLREKGLYITELNAGETERRGQRWLPWKSRAGVTALTEELAMLLEAGLPLHDALGTIAREVESKRLQRTALELARQINQGESFAAALGHFPGMFDPLYVSIVHTGETTGDLAAALTQLAGLYERSQKLRAAVLGALTYPIILCVVAVAVVIALLTVVIPPLADTLQAAGQVLPWPTRVLIAGSAAVRNGWPVGVAVLVGLGALAGMVRTRPGWRLRWHRLKLRLPVLGELFRRQALAQFALSLGSLLRSGVPLLQALSVAAQTLTNRALAQAVTAIREGIATGSDFSSQLRASQAFPVTVAEMIAVGEKSGHLETMLDKIAERCDRKVVRAAEYLVRVLEPAVILVMAVIVGFIVLSILLPILELGNVT